ncbi:MAG: glycosyl transferase family 2 [Gammaproteobacteria bacterium]|jgi:glycosyltransferase involved in cell wall biosynthesis|nr:glycosyl transferase family 2 [Gammaproteobacteria bacterium]
MKIAKLIENSKCFLGKAYGATLPQVTIVLPVHNGIQRKLFTEAVRSLLCQQGITIEIIIIDDASTDGTVQYILDSMLEDDRISLIVHDKKLESFPISAYEGYLKGKGDYFIFAEQNFVFSWNCLQKIYALIIDNRAPQMIVGIANQNGDKSFGNDPIQKLISRNIFSTSAVMIPRRCLEQVGLFDPQPLLNGCAVWDLWLRMSAQYPILQSKVFMGRKKGSEEKRATAKSLYCARAIMCLDRDEQLRANRFSELELMGPFSAEADKKGQPYKDDCVQRSEKTRKICILWFKEASPFYPFFALNETEKIDIIFLDIVAAIDSKNLITADLVIISRELLLHLSVIRWLNDLGIPWAYFIDDNFTVLAREYALVFAWYSHKNLQRHLASAKAVFTSTVPLQEYYQLHDLHPTVLHFPPVLSQKFVEKTKTFYEQCRREETFVVAMIGGDFRYPAFISTVLPALMKLSEQKDIIVWSTCEVPASIKLPPKMAVKRLKSIYDYEQFILKLIALGVDVVVHPHGKTQNLPYKTDAVLLMARYLHANIIIGDEPCFETVTDKDGVFKVENSTEAFYQAFLKLTDSATRQQKRYEQLQYCNLHYSPKPSEEKLKCFLQTLPLLSNFEMDRREKAMATFAFSGATLPKNRLQKLIKLTRANGFLWFLKAGFQYARRKAYNCI